MLKINHVSKKIAIGMLTVLSLSAFTPSSAQAGVKRRFIDLCNTIKSSTTNVVNELERIKVLDGAKVFGGFSMIVASLYNIKYIKNYNLLESILFLSAKVGYCFLSIKLLQEGLNGFLNKNNQELPKDQQEDHAVN